MTWARRFGFPKPANLKAWADRGWQTKLSETLTVSRVDEDIPTEKQTEERKPWFIALTQNPELLPAVGGVEGLPPGHTVLLSEDDVVALVQYLLEPQTAAWFENPSPIEPGSQDAIAFLEPGLVTLIDGEPVNGEAQWTPEYFRCQTPLAIEEGSTFPTRKLHTLPWKLVPW